MDPLSVGASIAGLLSITFKITSTLCGIANDAPRLVQSVVYETQALGAIFYQLQNHVMGVGQPSQHTNMVAVEQVVGILTACVCTFSELEKEIDGLQEGVRGQTRLLKPIDLVRWMFSGEPALKGLLAELQMQKTSLALILNILQSQSDSQAHESMVQLNSRFDELIKSNKKLSARLKRIEKSTLVETSAADSISDISSVPHAGPRSGVCRTHDTSSFSWPRPYPSHQSAISWVSRLTTFEEVLQRSRVYNKKNTADFLFYVDSLASANHTVLSGLTLSNISNLSVFELPLCVKELSSRVWFSEDWEENPHITEIRHYYARKPAPVPPSPGASPSRTFLARALRPYTAVPGLHELSFPHNAVLTIQNPSLNSSHWIATTWDKKTGLVPSSILLLLPHDPESLQFPFKAIATHSYQADHRDPNMLSFMSGEIIDTWDGDTSTRSWWRARKKNGECGLVPMNFMAIVPPAVSDEKAVEARWARTPLPEIPEKTNVGLAIRSKEEKRLENEGENFSGKDDEGEDARTPTWMRTFPRQNVVKPFIGDLNDEWYDNSVSLRTPTKILATSEIQRNTNSYSYTNAYLPLDSEPLEHFGISF